MSHEGMQHLMNLINQTALHLEPEENVFNSLLNEIGDARFVLIGEATHGTDEFYQTRIKITQQLIKRYGFMAVAIEGDWPDAYRVHRYVQGVGPITNHELALSDFARFPVWMWRNQTMPPFLRWLREHNDALPQKEKIGFYGLDLYSLHASIEAVIHYLNQIDKEAARRAKERYACFDHVNVDPQTYSYLVNAGIKKSCVTEAVSQLMELQHQRLMMVKNRGLSAEDDHFFAIQNARVVQDAEHYYRAMLEGRVSTWNIRDQHMAATLNALAVHLESHFNKPAKIIVWAHNSHIGDARATEMGERGEHNIGQLIREQYDRLAYSIGFSTYQGTVTAANNWDEPAHQKFITPGMPGSYEALFHQVKFKNFILHLRDNPMLEHLLKIPRLQRAIGVVYRPDTERASHYFFSRLPYQFDSIIHFDETHAVVPLLG